MRLLRSCWDHKSASEKHQLACKDGLVYNSSLQKNLDHKLDFHVMYTNLETCPCQSGDKKLMPWRRLLNKKKKSKKEFGQLSGEELFKFNHHHCPILKLMTTSHHHHQYLMMVLPARRGSNRRCLNSDSMNTLIWEPLKVSLRNTKTTLVTE